MAFNVLQKADGSVEIVADGSGSANELVKVVFATGVEAELGRGDTDADITYIALNRADGTKMFVHVDTGTAVIATTAKP